MISRQRIRLGDVLVQKQVITPEELQKALKEQKNRGTKLGETLMSMGFVSEQKMVEVLTEAGIRNYSIWIVGDEIFGYYECEKDADFAASVQKNSPVVDRWNEYMKEVMVMEMDPVTGAQPKMEQVWNFR